LTVVVAASPAETGAKTSAINATTQTSETSDLMVNLPFEAIKGTV